VLTLRSLRGLRCSFLLRGRRSLRRRRLTWTLLAVLGVMMTWRLPCVALAMAADPAAFGHLKVSELKVRLRERGLRTTGVKSDLLKRLQVAEGRGREASASKASMDWLTSPQPQHAIRSFYGLTCSELREELKARGLRVSGLKAELIARLTQAEQGAQPPKNPEGPRSDGAASARSRRSSTREASTGSIGRGAPAASSSSSPPAVDLSGFLSVTEQERLLGTVRAVMTFGVFVEVLPPRGGPPQWGLVSGVEEVELGQILPVRLELLEHRAGRLVFALWDED